MARINKCIELIQQGHPIFATGAPALDYDTGVEMAQTWADMVLIDFEHRPFDTVGLTAFMRGLKDGGPTPSGHPTPTVVTTLPMNCMTPEEVRYNAWQVRHVLTTGVHGLLHTHARDPEAVRTFVSTTRFPFQTIGRDLGLPEGLRGSGSQGAPAEIWGLSAVEYIQRADPWPLNPDGELMLGLKIEDRHSLPNADAIALVPGLSYAEWGPGDMSMSLGELDGHDPPYSEQMMNAFRTIKGACDRAGLGFYCSWNDESMTDAERVKYIMQELKINIMGAPDKAFADVGRELSGRTMPV